MSEKSQGWGYKKCFLLGICFTLLTVAASAWYMYSYDEVNIMMLNSNNSALSPIVNGTKRTNTQGYVSYLHPTSKPQLDVITNASSNSTEPPVVTHVVERPDLHGFVSYTQHNKFLQLHCQECALISSSGHLLDSNAGKDIDSSECVLRMNDAPVKGYEKDVGRKTTLRMVAHSSIGFVQKKENDLLNTVDAANYVVMWGPEKTMRSDGKGGSYNIGKKLAIKYKNSIDFYYLTQEQMNKCDKTYEIETGKTRGATGSWLSTGWFTMLLAINICDSIKVYGMVEADHCRKYPKSSIPYHYGDPKGTKECSLYNIMEAAKKNRHRFSLEKAIFARWSGLYNISFYHPEWTNPDITQEQIIHDFMSKKF